MRLVLPFNDTIVVFLHPSAVSVSEPTVVQISVKSDVRETVDVLAAWYIAEPTITELALRIIVAHLGDALPTSMVFEDDAYTLEAAHSVWTYGKEKVKFMCGEHVLRAANDKWTFAFKPKSKGEDRHSSSREKTSL